MRGTARTLEVVAGDGQRVMRDGLDPPGGIARFAPLAVRATDRFGRPVPGEGVSFTPGTHPAGMAVNVHPYYGSVATIHTNEQGIARLDQMNGDGVYCYYDEGPLTVDASLGSRAKATFSLTVAPSPPRQPVDATLAIVSGDGQTATRVPAQHVMGGIARFGPLRVRATDRAGKPLAGVVVDFAPGNHPAFMAVQVDPSGATPHSVATDMNGVATLAALAERIGGDVYGVFAYYSVGAFTVVASVVGGGSVSFSLTVAE